MKWVALATTLALTSSAFAQARKMLVLPLEGSAPADRRAALSNDVVTAARSGTGADVTLGDTTYAETAAAVGCAPEQAACAEQVRATLAVDELVYGTAETENGTTKVTITRVTEGAAPQTTTTTETGLATAFGAAPVETGSGSLAAPTSERGFFDTTERKVAIALFAGSGISIAIGLSLWSGANGLQDDIDSHPTTTRAQIDDLKDVEDRAASKALWGNVLVFGGLAIAGAGAYFLYKDHKRRSEPMLAPAPAPTGAGMTLVLRGQW